MITVPDFCPGLWAFSLLLATEMAGVQNKVSTQGVFPFAPE
jgi:hypothetical protein